MMKLASAQFHCNFPNFHCIESFCSHFQITSRLSFLQNLIFVLKSYSSYSCVNCFPMKIPSFILASLILGKICLTQANPSLEVTISFIDIFIKLSLICKGGEQNFDLSPKAECVHFSDLVLFLYIVGIFLFCSGSPLLSCPIYTKSSRIQCIHLVAQAALQ